MNATKLSDAVAPVAFTKEIQSMMHAFGDNPVPLPSSVKLVETVLCRQLHCLLNKAREVCALRGSQCIGIEEILFLMRKDRIKLNRLLNYLAVKDFHSSVATQLSNNPIDHCSGEVPSKRKQICMNFLETIDTTGELTSKIQPFDAIKHERNLRAESMTQSMDENRYLEYASARRQSFTYRSGGVNKIQLWLQSSKMFPDLPKSNQLLYEILAYLAYETVAQIVDLSLLVRQDGAAKPGDPFSYYVAGFTRMPGSYPVQYAAELTGIQLGGPPPLTPQEIREALRRYWSPLVTPWSPFSRSLSSNVYSKLLMC